MITLDTSVVVKWFKPGERFATEALRLRERLERRELDGAACDIVSLEVVRALKNAMVRQPHLAISDPAIEAAFACIEGMFETAILLECSVRDVKVMAKDIEIELGLFMADALHLATASYLRTEFFVVDDHHFLSPSVLSYASRHGVRVLILPDLFAALA